MLIVIVRHNNQDLLSDVVSASMEEIQGIMVRGGWVWSEEERHFTKKVGNLRKNAEIIKLTPLEAFSVLPRIEMVKLPPLLSID